jgi:hypothetical protein
VSQLDFEVDLSGKDLAEGFYLTQLALPNTAPFKLHAHIARNDMRVPCPISRARSAKATCTASWTSIPAASVLICVVISSPNNFA